MQAPISFLTNSPEETSGVAKRFGAVLGPGDCVLLVGGIGAGKTHFCRSLIQSLLREPEDVPSPTFTLVQTYDSPTSQIWHADLYRLSDPQEVFELGLSDAFDTAICLIEWPDRLGPDTPKDALTLRLEPDIADENTRKLTLDWSAPTWNKRLKGVFDNV